MCVRCVSMCSVWVCGVCWCAVGVLLVCFWLHVCWCALLLCVVVVCRTCRRHSFCSLFMKTTQFRTHAFHVMCCFKPLAFHNGFMFLLLVAVSSTFRLILEEVQL